MVNLKQINLINLQAMQTIVGKLDLTTLNEKELGMVKIRKLKSHHLGRNMNWNDMSMLKLGHRQVIL